MREHDPKDLAKGRSDSSPAPPPDVHSETSTTEYEMTLVKGSKIVGQRIFTPPSSDSEIHKTTKQDGKPLQNPKIAEKKCNATSGSRAVRIASKDNTKGTETLDLKAVKLASFSSNSIFVLDALLESLESIRLALQTTKLKVIGHTLNANGSKIRERVLHFKKSKHLAGGLLLMLAFTLLLIPACQFWRRLVHDWVDVFFDLLLFPILLAAAIAFIVLLGLFASSMQEAHE